MSYNELYQYMVLLIKKRGRIELPCKTFESACELASDSVNNNWMVKKAEIYRLDDFNKGYLLKEVSKG